MKTVLITGITGQDGSFLANQLLEEGGYQIYGLVRSVSNETMKFLKQVGLDKIEIIQGDISDFSFINNTVRKYQFDYIYNFAAQSNVSLSYEQPIYTLEISGLSVLYFLEAIKSGSRQTRFLQASSSEVFDSSIGLDFYNEESPRLPSSPYGIAKNLADQYVAHYRKNYDIFACSAIFFNHESDRRGSQFLTKKVIKYVVDYEQDNTIESLKLGNLLVSKDWGYAPEYVQAARLMLESPYPNDYVIGTGYNNTAMDFVNLAFMYSGVNIQWSDDLLTATDPDTGNCIVNIDPLLLRPNYQNSVIADASKIKQNLNWEVKVSFSELISSMLHYERLHYASSTN